MKVQYSRRKFLEDTGSVVKDGEWISNLETNAVHEGGGHHPKSIH